jgi:hypothetical protein
MPKAKTAATTAWRSEWQPPKRERSRCGARTRAGHPCKRLPIEGKKRCRNHGGQARAQKLKKGASGPSPTCSGAGQDSYDRRLTKEPSIFLRLSSANVMVSTPPSTPVTTPSPNCGWEIWSPTLNAGGCWVMKPGLARWRSCGTEPVFLAPDEDRKAVFSFSDLSRAIGATL